MKKKSTNTIINETLPMCITCRLFPLFQSITYTSTHSLIFTYKCKCNEHKSVLLSNYLEDFFLFTQLLVNKCNCGADSKFYCSACELYICDICLSVHKTHLLFTKQIIIPITKCQKHRKVFSHFCYKCNNQICEECVKKEHIKHRVKQYDFYYTEANKKISPFALKYEEKITKQCELFSIDKRGKNIKAIMALYSFYLNGFKAAKQIKSFELISSMLKLIDLSLNPHEKKFIRYNKVPHLFLNRPITTEQFEYKKIISTKTGNILLIYSESFELYSPNHRLIKKEKMEFNWNGSIEFLNKEKFGIFSNLKIKIYETDSCSLIKEIPLSKDYKQYSYTIIDDDHVCLYSKKQAVILNINTKEESKIPLITNEYFTIRPLKKDSIILLSSSGFGIYNLITKECEKTFKYNENKIYVMFGFPINNINKSYEYHSIIITDNVFVIITISYSESKMIIYGFSTKDYEMKYEKNVKRDIISENQFTKDYFLLTDEKGIKMYDISNGDMITEYKMGKTIRNELKKVVWLSERYVIIKREYKDDLYILN